jgi:plasmid stability protein
MLVMTNKEQVAMDDSKFTLFTDDWSDTDTAVETSVPDQPGAREARGAFVCSDGSSALAPPASGKNVAQLVVRNLPDDIVRALKQRAARNNRSAEQEHREILLAALRGPRRRPLADVLASMPNVGRDEDFARDQNDTRG